MKSGINKIAACLGITLGAIVVLAVLLFTVFGNTAIKKGIEAGGSAALKVNVEVKDVNLSLLGGTFAMSDLVIQNPQGYQLPHFLSLGKGLVALNTGSLMSDTIEITNVVLEGIEVTLEQKSITENNIQTILNNLPKSDNTQEPQPAKTDSQGKKIIIRELSIKNVHVKAKLLPIPGKADTLTLPLSTIVLKDLGADKPMNAAELTGKIINAIAGGIAKEGKEILPLDMLSSLSKDLSEQGQKILKDISETGKEALGDAGKAGEGLLKNAGDVGKQATDSLKGLFEKKE